MIPVITVDGPSGSGKGTIAQRVAQSLGWHFLDSGAIYRALGLYAEQQGIGSEEVDALAALARARCKKDFHLSIGKNHRPHVPPIGHQTGGAGKLTLPFK
ncbi:hypothetical protein QQ73_07910 [Candidatus Endoriftia persephone str. Guaymas]|nr:hypothetical protein [Candidatus Endoriftia persephone str. Guaymas]